MPSPDDSRAATLGQILDEAPKLLKRVEDPLKILRTARDTWESPAAMVKEDHCTRCHDTGPLKGSPWLEQALNIPPNPPRLPYLVVGDLFSHGKEAPLLRAISTADVPNSEGGVDPQVCTTCHRIGNQATCREEIGFAVGATARTHVVSLPQRFATAWMPPHERVDDAEDRGGAAERWRKRYGRHLDRLACCCQHPQALNCSSQDITKDPLPPPVPGHGPGRCD